MTQLDLSSIVRLSLSNTIVSAQNLVAGIRSGSIRSVTFGFAPEEEWKSESERFSEDWKSRRSDRFKSVERANRIKWRSDC